ncbi:MAG: hypothetical protein IMX00_01255 [Limnochordales bacterium]|nr:hypothetical protein [Limnochordales bacterium]
MRQSGRSVHGLRRLLRLVAAGVVAGSLLVGLAVAGGLAAEDEGTYLWTMDTLGEVFSYKDDNTGARFKLSDQYVIQGQRSVSVIPSGSAIETKLAIPLDGERLAAWIGSDAVIINIYLPPENKLNPSKFFLGMADVTTDWAWVEGTFSSTVVKAGWNQVRFDLPEPMKKVNKNGKYMLYFAFIGYDASGTNKLPLSEMFYLDGIRVVKAAAEQ